MTTIGPIRFVGGALGFLLGLSGVQQAFAQAAPVAQTGFQMAFRTGFAVPLGSVADDDALGFAPFGSADMSDTVSTHVPLIVDIGGKLSKNVFLGGYLGLAFGGVGGTSADRCDRGGFDCSSAGFRFGAQVHYQFLPAEKMNPWVGYGIGFESLALVAENERTGQDTAFGVGGFEFAHIMAGLDFRLSHGFGIGPFLDFSMGTYSAFRFETDVADLDDEGSIEETALHEWLMLGARFVILP